MTAIFRKLYAVRCTLYAQKAFTLIELLVAISILAVVGTLLIVDFGPFKEERSLQIVSSQVQNFVRLAQINATAGVLCNDVSGASWSVKFIQGSDEIKMMCQTSTAEAIPVESRTMKLEQEVEIASLSVDVVQITENSGTCNDLEITFSHILGKVSFSSTDTNCNTSTAQYAGIVLAKNADKKFVIINKGGVVYIE